MLLSLLLGCLRLSQRLKEPAELVVLTGDMVEELGLEELELRRLKYYLSGQLVLVRDNNPKGDGSVANYQLNVNRNRSITKVVVRPYTPGQIEMGGDRVGNTHGEHCLNVSFQERHELIFCAYRGGPYALIDTNERNLWDRFMAYWHEEPPAAPRTWFLDSHWAVEDGVGVRLLVERNSFGTFTYESKVLKGME